MESGHNVDLIMYALRGLFGLYFWAGYCVLSIEAILDERNMGYRYTQLVLC